MQDFFSEINNRKQNTCFEWGSEDYYITDSPKPENLENKFLWNTEKPKTCAYISIKADKTPEKST